MGTEGHSYLTTAQLADLEIAAVPVLDAFNSPPYLVGSVEERADFRDVDVRTILDDDEFDALFGERPQLWALVCLLTRWIEDDPSLATAFARSLDSGQLSKECLSLLAKHGASVAA